VYTLNFSEKVGLDLDVNGPADVDRVRIEGLRDLTEVTVIELLAYIQIRFHNVVLATV